MLLTLAAGAAIVWAAACVALAVVLRRRGFGASLNPLHWIPFFVLAPLILLGFLVLAVLAVLFFSIADLCRRLAVRLGWPEPQIEDDLLRARLGDGGVALAVGEADPHLTLAWEEIEEWQRLFSGPVFFHRLVLASGEEIEIEVLETDDETGDDLAPQLERHGVRFTATTRWELEEEDEEA